MMYIIKYKPIFLKTKARLNIEGGEKRPNSKAIQSNAVVLFSQAGRGNFA